MNSKGEDHKLPSNRPISIFLDQSRWVDLHLADAGKPRQGARLALELLREANDRQLVRLPLAPVHYLESWHRNSWQDRHALAEIMRELSGLVTLAPLEVVTAAEMQTLCANLTGKQGPDLLRVVFGRGVNHAFNSDTGRFVFVETLPASIYAKPGEHPPDAFFMEIQRTQPELYEWMNLAGPPVDWDDVPDEFHFETRPEHLRGNDWVDHENLMRMRLAEQGSQGNIRDVLVAEDVGCLVDDLNDVAVDYGIAPQLLVGGSLAKARDLIASLPSRYTLVELEFARLRDTQYQPQQHDRSDLISHAVAVPYCDVIVTERRMASLLRQGKLGQRFGTLILQGLDELAALLQRIDVDYGVEHLLDPQH